VRIQSRATASLRDSVVAALPGCGRLAVLVEPFEPLLVDRQRDPPFDDLAHELGRHVARLAEQARADCEPVEDVARRVADRLLDLPELLAAAAGDLPALLDQVPGDRVGH